MKSAWWLAMVLGVIVVFWVRTVLVKEHDIATSEIDGMSSAEAGDYGLTVSFNAIVSFLASNPLTASADDDYARSHVGGILKQM
jgi:hypothetical protein